MESLNRKGVLRGLTVYKTDFFHVSVTFPPNHTARHEYDVWDTSEAIPLLKFMASHERIRKDGMNLGLTIPGMFKFKALKDLIAFEPDFDSDWFHKPVLSTFYVMSR